MNERLRLLAHQAWVDNDNMDAGGYTDLEKFAESIIAETCKMLAENKEFRAAVLVGKHFPLWK
jgi:hypothetical protein